MVDDLSLRPPDETTQRGSRTWTVRGRHVVASVVQLLEDDPLVARQVADEHVLLVPGGVAVTLQHGDSPPVVVADAAVVIVPPGSCVVRASAPTTLVRVSTARRPDRGARAVDHTAGADPRVAPGDGAGPGSDVRVHRVDDAPADPGRLGRVYRTADLMVNWFPVRHGPRDTEQLSPHAHDDVEQLSVTLAGDHVHHLRVPWGARLSEWRDDQHVQVGSPSMTLVPPTVVHTTHAVGDGDHVLVDVFGPPRQDVLDRGWVLNGDDYAGTGR